MVLMVGSLKISIEVEASKESREKSRKKERPHGSYEGVRVPGDVDRARSEAMRDRMFMMLR